MIELKPCPFCGGEAEYFENYYHGCNIYCQKCGVEFECDSEAEAIEAWNRRAAPVVDAKPVVHGKWEANCTCSCCGYCRQMTRSGNYMVGNYCPNCGADMRGETDE